MEKIQKTPLKRDEEFHFLAEQKAKKLEEKFSHLKDERIPLKKFLLQDSKNTNIFVMR